MSYRDSITSIRHHRGIQPTYYIFMAILGWSQFKEYHCVRWQGWERCIVLLCDVVFLDIFNNCSAPISDSDK